MALSLITKLFQRWRHRFSICTIIEGRVVIRVLWSESMKTSEILGRMLAQYGENCMVQKYVVEKFKHGKKTLDYEEK